MVALFQLGGAAATASRENVSRGGVPADRGTVFRLREPPGLEAANTSKTAPVAASDVAATTPAHASGVLLDVPITVAWPAIVVGVVIAPVVLGDRVGGVVMMPSVVRVVRRGCGGQRHSGDTAEHHGSGGEDAGESVKRHLCPFHNCLMVNRSLEAFTPSRTRTGTDPF